MARVWVGIEDRKVALKNLDKVMYPTSGMTKAEVIDYYRQVAPFMLPHLEGRPVVMKRYPDGVAGDAFYEKECPAYRPDWMETVRLRGEEKPHTDYCVFGEMAALIWAANLASLELHTLLSRREDLDCPTALALDLDPGAPADIFDCIRVALPLRETLRTMGLESFPKLSGGKGLHFFVPLNTPVTFDDTRQFAETVARTFEARAPEMVTSRMFKSARRGKVLIDWSQNDYHRTTIAPYSLRGRECPTVSMPVTWEELEEALDREDRCALVFECERALERVGKAGDAFRPVLELKQRLPRL